jgi:hypothetical protein
MLYLYYMEHVKIFQWPVNSTQIMLKSMTHKPKTKREKKESRPFIHLHGQFKDFDTLTPLILWLYMVLLSCILFQCACYSCKILLFCSPNWYLHLYPCFTSFLLYLCILCACIFFSSFFLSVIVLCSLGWSQTTDPPSSATWVLRL